MSNLKKRGIGREIGNIEIRDGDCICKRPHTNVICHICGYVGLGRLRYPCPVHPKTIFLIDIGQCPKCRSHSFQMSEFSTIKVYTGERYRHPLGNKN